MSQNRREFLAASIGVLTVTKAAAQGAAPAAGPPRKIGIVTGISFDLEFQACFLAGLADDGWQPPPSAKPIIFPNPPGGHNPGQANGKYGGTQGRTVIRKLINDHTRGNVHLIVVAGGLTAQTAAFEELQSVNVPFVYLAGHFPAPLSPGAAPPPLGKYCGVNLNYSERHFDAASALAHGGDTSSIWLVENGNSDMAILECTDWQRDLNNNCFFFFSNPRIDNPDPSNARSAYLSEIINLKAQNPTPTGVVISSDPYFRTTAPALVDAIKNLLPNVPVCYPFKDYELRPGLDILLSKAPSLSSDTPSDPKNAYFQLGKRTADVLNNSTANNPIPSTKRPSKMWDGSQWVDG
jgi:hypothetical protein